MFLISVNRLEIFFILWLVIALICTVIIWVIDIHTTGYLVRPFKMMDKWDLHNSVSNVKSSPKTYTRLPQTLSLPMYRVLLHLCNIVDE